jgi:CPA1 family monovalent cation:H+ antiporter
MHHLELLLLFLLLAVLGLTALAQRLAIPYPILLVTGGSALGFAPGVPDVALDPKVVLLVFLPPLLFDLAYFASVRDLRAHLRPIGLQAVLLVLLTACVMAVALKLALPDLPWAAAFAFGAIASPTDPLAAVSISRRLGVPRRLLTMIEGESLVNDGTALVLYRTAVAAAVGGSFVLGHAVLDFIVSVAGGVAVGLAVGYALIPMFRRVTEDVITVTLTLAAGYLAYLPAERLGVSGVIAAVTVGLLLGHRSEHLTSPGARLRGYAFWEVLVFLLNALLFVLVGLQLPHVLEEQSRPALELAGLGTLAGAVVIGVRMFYVNTMPFVVRALDRRPGQIERRVGWQERQIIGWSGLRGAVSLAAALALPAAFPERDLIVFLTLCVIFATLVVQGLTLPLLIRLLGVRDDHATAAEALQARIAANDAALQHLAQLHEEDPERAERARRLGERYEIRRERLAERADDDGGGELDERFAVHQSIHEDILNVQREEIARLRSEGKVSSAAMREVERELDLEHERLGR